MPVEHTPGPWWRDDDGFVAAGFADTYVTIADFDCCDSIDPDEREANKTLAIAAPEMLAALRTLLAAPALNLEGLESADAAAITAAETAIAKAEGRS